MLRPSGTGVYRTFVEAEGAAALSGFALGLLVP